MGSQKTDVAGRWMSPERMLLRSMLNGWDQQGGIILRADWFENLGPDGGWGWKARGEFAAGPKNTVETKFGFNFKAKNVRFAE